MLDGEWAYGTFGLTLGRQVKNGPVIAADERPGTEPRPTRGYAP
jgi:hypothetical protein